METRHIALSSLFSLVIFFQKFLLPAPYDKVLSILLQITLFSLAFFIMGTVGPLVTSGISGVLIASMRGSLAVMTILFSLLYGVLVGVLYRMLGVHASDQIYRGRLLVASTVATLIVGVVSAGTSMLLGVIPYTPVLVVVMMSAGALQGVLGGYLSYVVWVKYFYKLVD